MNSGLVTVQELAEATNRWCKEHGVVPASGQAGERITERNIRYYRARGILDAPGAGAGEKRRGFSEKHAGQLRALRLLQARSVPLEEIGKQLRGRSVEELRRIEEEELRRMRGGDAPMSAGTVPENWQITAVGGEYLLISRRGQIPTEEQRARIAATLGVAT